MNIDQPIAEMKQFLTQVGIAATDPMLPDEQRDYIRAKLMELKDHADNMLMRLNAQDVKQEILLLPAN